VFNKIDETKLFVIWSRFKCCQ